VINNTITTFAKMKGKIALLIFSMDSPEIMEEANKQQPTGGVASPVIKLTHMKIPACNGSIPNISKTGNKTGVTIIKAGMESINMPKKNNNTLISNNISHVDSMFSTKYSAKIIGNSSLDNAQPKIPAAAIMIDTLPVSTVELRMALISFLKVIER